MQELFDLSFTPANLFPTILLVFVLLYWLVFLFGLLDLSFMDIDLDKDIGLEAELDLDAELDAEVDHSLPGKSIGVRFFQFLNLGDIPLMVFMSFFALFFWAGSILGNAYLSSGALGMTIGIGAGAFFLGLLMTKVITQPFRKMFRSLNQAEKPIDLRGKICTIELGTQGERLGQAEIAIDGKHLLINVRSEFGNRINQGMRCVILGEGPGQEFYFVQPLELEE